MSIRRTILTTAAAAAAVLTLGACTFDPPAQDGTAHLQNELHKAGADCDWDLDKRETITIASCGELFVLIVSDPKHPDQEGINEHDEATRPAFRDGGVTVRGRNYAAFAAAGDPAGQLAAATGSSPVTL